MSTIQSATEVGIIESRQVINIINSVVQRTSFGGNGKGTGTTSVSIEDSVVQRSTIGVGTTKKCPKCGHEVSEDEKFCPKCGEQMK